SRLGRHGKTRALRALSRGMVETGCPEFGDPRRKVGPFRGEARRNRLWRNSRTHILRDIRYSLAGRSEVPACCGQLLRHHAAVACACRRSDEVSVMPARMSAISAASCIALLATVGIALAEPVDESALREYARQNRADRVEMETRRLERLYPLWKPPADL